MQAAYETTVMVVTLTAGGDPSSPQQFSIPVNNRFIHSIAASMLTASAVDGYFRILDSGKPVYPQNGWHAVANGVASPLIPLGVNVQGTLVLEAYTPNGSDRSIEVFVITSSSNYEASVATLVEIAKDFIHKFAAYLNLNK